jgi:hypothetical protein
VEKDRSPLWQASALLPNIRLGWRGIITSNTLTYFGPFDGDREKCFTTLITQATLPNFLVCHQRSQQIR